MSGLDLEKLGKVGFRKRMKALQQKAYVHKARFVDDTPELQLKRKAWAVVSPEYFNSVYLGHYFKSEPAPFHKQLYRALEQNRRTCVRASRGMAKSTVVNFGYGSHQVACAAVLKQWVEGTLEANEPELYAAIVEVIEQVNAERKLEHQTELNLAGEYGTAERVEELLARGPELVKLWFDPYIQIIAVDKDLATEFTQAIKEELETNEVILGDWGQQITDVGKNYHDFVTVPDGDIGFRGVRVKAFGMRTGIRGGKHGPDRPTLGLIDDPDSAETVTSEKVWKKQRRKISAGIEYGLHPEFGRIFMIGTPLHSECLVVYYSLDERFKKRWKVLRFAAITETGESLWEERWTLAQLAIVEEEDPEAFLSEMMDTPPSDSDKPFEALSYYSREDYADERLQKVLVFDPAVGKNKRSDGQAVAVLRGPTKSGDLLVHRTESLRIPGLLELEARVNGIADEEDCDAEFAESIGFQEFVVQILELRSDEDGALRRWQRIESHKESKDLRLRGLASMSNRGKLRFPDDHSCRAGEREALSYPHGKKDILDCIEMGARVMRRQSRRRSFGDISSRFVRRPHASAMASGDWI